MAHARRTLPVKAFVQNKMREFIELPLLGSSLQPRIALAQVAVKLDITLKQTTYLGTFPRGKHLQSGCALQIDECLSLAADIFEMRCANHCSKLAANCSERWVGVEALQSGLLIPPRFVAQSRLLNRATSIPGLTTGAITELLATEALALLVKG